VDEFLDKLQEDQRRMRKYLSAKGLRFRAMGEALAACADAGGRVFVAGEPPLDLLTRVIGHEYFPHLSVVLIDDPEETAVELGDDDVLLAFLHEGKHKRIRRLLERARARHATVLIVGGLGARTPSTKRQAEVMITLPTRGIKTVVESCFICARILARVSRAALTRSHEGEPVESGRKTRSDSRRSKSKSSGRKSEDTRSKSSRRSKRKSSGRKSERVRTKSKSKSAPADEELEPTSEPRISRRKRKKKLKPSVLELPTISPSELESRPPSGNLVEEPLEEIPLEEVQAGDDLLDLDDEGLDGDLDGDLGDEGLDGDVLDDDLDELEDIDLDELEAKLEEAPEDAEESVDLGESVDLDEDLDEEDLDDIDLGESVDEGDDPFADVDLAELGAAPRTSSSRPKPISRGPDGSLGEAEVEATRSEHFSPPPLVDDAPVGLVSHEDAPAGPTFGSDIMLGSDVGVVSANPPTDLGPISFDDDFLSDLEVQRPASGSRSASEPHDGISARMVSARFSVQDCTIRWGRGGFPDDSSPAHTLLDFDGGQALFLLDHDDEAAATLAIEDELWVRIEVPAFLEPILTRARILDLAGSAGNGGTTATLQFSELEAQTRQKLERAAAARR
jgi:hypothetical protein